MSSGARRRTGEIHIRREPGWDPAPESVRIHAPSESAPLHGRKRLALHTPRESAPLAATPTGYSHASREPGRFAMEMNR